MKLLLTRDFKQPDPGCTLGRMLAGDEVFYTIERPWVPSNMSSGGLDGKSCVPLGLYSLALHRSDAHPYSFCLVNPDLDVVHWEDPKRPWLRALVLIHIANYARELRGCIAVGNRNGPIPGGVGQYQVFDSSRAFRRFNSVVRWVEGHQLEIVQATP